MPRWAHRLYAHLLGYFWKACPGCGRMFGGHESDRAMRGNQLVCRDCAAPKVTLGFIADIPIVTIQAGHASQVADWLDAWARDQGCIRA